MNPLTGPFHVEGAEPGDTLAVHFVSIEPSRDWAASTHHPAVRRPHLHPRHPGPAGAAPGAGLDVRRRQRSRARSTFRARLSDDTVELPLDPMHGTVGVAPASFEVRSSLVPDAHGGNMDTPEMRAGVTCFLGVNVEGALFALGDGHCRQGEGETCGVAVEAAMDTTVIVDVIKAVATPWPRLESDDHLMSTGSARPLEDAFRIAQHDLVTWIGARVRARPARLLPAGHPGLRVADRQRLRPQLHGGREDPQALPAPPRRLRRRPRAPEGDEHGLPGPAPVGRPPRPTPRHSRRHEPDQSPVSNNLASLSGAQNR